jgi:hypothetical protein
MLRSGIDQDAEASSQTAAKGTPWFSPAQIKFNLSDVRKVYCSPVTWHKHDIRVIKDHLKMDMHV